MKEKIGILLEKIKDMNINFNHGGVNLVINEEGFKLNVAKKEQKKLENK
ncbi:hypothetical protein Goe21_01140 [Bacillus phage vB_BsuM-Goe21]|nr:hypothetical protein INTERNEXUS_282 [Bacillus phage vB_BspM_Internexus]WCS68224.1 hypothetical protein Goe21_01140 [Bacillus phage vB_BsuM-Goe21]